MLEDVINDKNFRGTFGKWVEIFAICCGISSTFLLGLNMLLTMLNNNPMFNGGMLVWTMPLYFSVEGYFEIPVFFLGMFLLFYVLYKTFKQLTREIDTSNNFLEETKLKGDNL